MSFRRRQRGDRGAAALEFGLLVPVLFLMLFGIIDYGLWFSDSLTVRQSVREGARVGAVARWDQGCSASAGLADLACQIKRDDLVTLTGDKYVKIIAPSGWARGNPLLVCGMVSAQGVTGLVPLPSDGLIKSETRMSIEAASAPGGSTAHIDPAPAGGDWSWCS